MVFPALAQVCPEARRLVVADVNDSRVRAGESICAPTYSARKRFSRGYAGEPYAGEANLATYFPRTRG